MISLAEVQDLARDKGLNILGAHHPDGGQKTRVLLGPDEPGGFWDVFQASPEALDRAPDPMNRWSERVINDLATKLDAVAEYPFSGPPWQPFHEWALETGRCHNSPVGLLVHDRAGLWVSFRGALLMSGQIDLPQSPPNPCDSCLGRPCLTACPIGALGNGGYDVPSCKSYLKTKAGSDCMAAGCQVRAACPVSRKWGRMTEQSNYHMKAFLGA